MNPFGKVKDSSIWRVSDNYAAAHKKDPYMRIGVILKAEDDVSGGEIKYLVETRDTNDTVTMWCRALTRMGGVYNFEEYSMRGYVRTPLTSQADYFKSKAGDFVLVASLNGETREGVILGGLKHSGRKSELTAKDDPTYISEFNGIETRITKEGEYTLTYKGNPINASALTAPATGVPIVPPIYDPTTTGSYIKFDKTGSWEVNDKSLTGEQSIKLDKSGGKISIKAGTAEFTIEKLSQAVTLKGISYKADLKKSISLKTAQFSVEAVATIKLKGKQIAIGSDQVELFDQLVQLITEIGTLQPVSPVGSCTPLMATPTWAKVEAIKTKLSLIKGSL